MEEDTPAIRYEKGDKTFRAVCCGDGSVWHFLNSSLGPCTSSPPCNDQTYLVEPFKSAIQDNGNLRRCRVAGPDKWTKASQVIERQLQLYGGDGVRLHGMEKGVEVDGVPIYSKKKVVCCRQGVHKIIKKEDRPSSSTSSSSSHQQASSSSSSSSSTTTTTPRSTDETGSSTHSSSAFSKPRNCSQRVRVDGGSRDGLLYGQLRSGSPLTCPSYVLH